MDALDCLLDQWRPAFSTPRAFDRARALAVASLLCLGRRTVTGLLTTCGRQFADWSAAYRLFERERFEPDQLFAPIRRAVVDSLDDQQPVLAVVDDTTLPRKGRKVSDAAWRHDPHGPKFTHQIHWAQRLLQVSAICPPSDADDSPRAVPLDAALQRVPKKPPAKASPRTHKTYRKAVKTNALPAVAAGRVRSLRKALDADGQRRRLLLVAVDGGYTNKTFLSKLPARVAVVGRLRKDAKLFAPAPQLDSLPRGRKRLYGDPLPTPQQLLEDKTVPVVEVQARAAGQTRVFRVKTIERCRWSKAGGENDIRLVVIEPLSLHPHQKGRRLYFAHPAYLLCTDPTVPLQIVLQAYIHRWEIEVGFREEKTLLGVGQAQVRQRHAVERVPQFQIAAYAALLLAARQTLDHKHCLALPKWRRSEDTPQRVSTTQIISLLRFETWGRALGLRNKNDFVPKPRHKANPPKIQNTAHSAVLYATG